MTHKTAPVKTRPADWREVNRVYDKILYYFYELGSHAKALAYTDKLHDLLSRLASDHDSIFGEECWSLLYELKGDLPTAIRHREREIELILKLWEISADTPGMDVALRAYGIAELADRFDLLAMLYHDAGDLDRAIVTLTSSKWLCESFKVPFEGESLLQDYLYEKNVNSSLYQALKKQGWKLAEPRHAPTTPPVAPARAARARRTRRRGKTA
jgi:tetratricopeptide (TPR) repeat protein